MKWTDDWFNANFFDIRKHKPKKGQILAQYRAVAYFVDDWVKRNVINIIKDNAVGAETAQKVMHNMCGALEEDSIRVPLEMAKDLALGMSVDEVAKKEYRMIIQYSFWTERENVPKDDPHWFVIQMLNTDDIDDKVKFTYTIPD
jgi:hypothetical protein